MPTKRVVLLVVVASLLVVSGCRTTSTPEQRVEALTLGSDNLAQRQAQSRRYETTDEQKILAACAGLLQDLGFSIDESSVETGLLSASKDRKASEWATGGGDLMFMGLIHSLGSQDNPNWVKKQRIRAAIVTKPVAGGSILVRVTFQRAVWDTGNAVSRIETVNDPKIYQEFFDKLSQSIFLEAHQI